MAKVIAKSTCKNIVSYGKSLTGVFLFAFALNIIIVPHELFSGTITGIAQIIESLITSYAPIQMPESFSLTGPALLMINIPLLTLALRVTNINFLIKNIICVAFVSLSMSFIPIPMEPIIYDLLTASIVGGAIAGFGIGFTLRSGGSGGGSDLVGIYCSVKYPNFTVGRVTL